MDLRAVFLDLDDTLCDARPAWRAGEAAAFELLRDRRPGLDVEAARAAWSQVNEELLGQLAAGALSMAQVRDRRFRALLHRIHVDDEALADELNGALAEVRLQHMRLFDDVIPGLQALRRHWHVGVITNGAGDDHDDSQWSVLRHLGLLDLVDSIWISDIVGFRKPDPRIFEGALEEVGVDAAQAAHVGDSLAADVAGAQAAGMVGVWLQRSAEAPLPDDGPRPRLRVDGLAALAPALQALQ